MEAITAPLTAAQATGLGMEDRPGITSAREKHAGDNDIVYVEFMHMNDTDEDGVLIEPPRKVCTVLLVCTVWLSNHRDQVLVAPQIYEQFAMGNVRPFVQESMNRLNETVPHRALYLVLFDDALRHLIRVSRVIGTPRGHAIVLGVGGSGKQSLTKLAAYLCGHTLFMLTSARVNSRASYLEDLRVAVRQAGLSCKPVCVMLNESDVRGDQGGILQPLNSLICTGDVPGLFTKDEMIVMTSELAAIAAKQVRGPLCNSIVDCG